MEVQMVNTSEIVEKMIAAAGRLCYSNPESPYNMLVGLGGDEADKMVAKLHDMGHLSTFEHVLFTFAVFGISRACSHQLVRHRLASYSQQSQRYVNMNHAEAVMPPSVANGDHVETLFKAQMDSAWSTYRILVEKGVPAEDARYVLPNACQTKILVSMNARELLHFFNKRCCNRAQWEIRAVATEMLRLVKREFPVLFHNAGPSCMDHPCPEKDKTCGKPWKRWPDYDKVLPFSEGSDV